VATTVKVGSVDVYTDRANGDGFFITETRDLEIHVSNHFGNGSRLSLKRHFHNGDRYIHTVSEIPSLSLLEMRRLLEILELAIEDAEGFASAETESAESAE